MSVLKGQTLNLKLTNCLYAGVTQIGRVTAFQAVGRGFESRLPLFYLRRMYYAYVLKSLRDGNLYIGQTSDLDKRLRSHNSGRVKSTKRRAPFELIYVDEFSTRGEAMKREKLLKDIKSRDFKRMLRNTPSAG